MTAAKRRIFRRSTCTFRLPKPIHRGLPKPSTQKKTPDHAGAQRTLVEDRGLEPEASSPQKTPFLKQGNAQYNALFGDDERLRVLREAWAELPESVKRAVRH